MKIEKEGLIIIRLLESDSKYIQFNDIIFEEQVIIVGNKAPIHITNCIFKNGLELENCNEHIVFFGNNCIINKILLIKECSSTIRISSNSKINEIISISSSGDVIITDSTINRCGFSNGEEKEFDILSIKNTTFNNQFHISNKHFTTFLIDGCIFNSEIKISDCSFKENSLILQNNQFKINSNLILENIVGDKNIILLNSTGILNFNLENISFKELNIFNNTELTFETISLDFNKIPSGIHISETNIKNLELSGNNENRNVEISNCNIKTIKIEYLFTKQGISLSNIKYNNRYNDGIFEIHHSNLENFIFNYVDFSSYKTFVFYNSIITKCLFFSCNFDRIIRGIKNKIIDNNHDRLGILTQLRVNFKSQDDKEMSFKFYQAKMTEEEKITQNQISDPNISLLSRISNIENFLILKFSRISSNFGESIVRPIIFNTSLHLFLYSIYIISNIKTCLTVEYILNNFDLDKISLNDIFYTAMPFREIDKENIFIDFLMRTNFIHFTYNIVRASRKYNY